MKIDREQLRAAVRLGPFDDDAARAEMGLSPRRRFPEVSYRDGAVLLLHYPTDAGTTLVLTRRTDTVEHHRRQISFPGGGREGDEDLVTTALREAEEEVGVPPDGIEILGRLPVLRIPVSRFEVTPVVAWRLSRPDFVIDPREVERVIEVPLARLLDDAARGTEDLDIRGETHRVPFFALEHVGPPPLWGATAMILAGFLARLRAVI